jgi:prevent-host-death family protein
MNASSAVNLLSASATLTEMSETVDIAELGRDPAQYVRRAKAGERVVVTDQGRPVAELGPAPLQGSVLDPLIAEGKVRPPKRRGELPEPLKLDLEPGALTRALEEVRGYR